MRRSKGSFRKGRKSGARSNLHNFRSSPYEIIATIAEEVEAYVEKVVEKVPEKVEENVTTKNRGRPKRHG